MQYVIELPEDLKRMIIDEGRFEVAHAYRLAACVKAGVALPEQLYVRKKDVDRVEALVAATDEDMDALTRAVQGRK